MLLDQVLRHVQGVRMKPTGEAPTSTAITFATGSTTEVPRYRERFWTLDPIDGTKGFLRGEQYAVALALIVGGEVVVAALACPNLGAPERFR